MAKKNVRQHVVSRYYLTGFTDPAEKVHCRDLKTGLSFEANPGDLCVEKEAYTILRDGVQDKSCDEINGRLEGPISKVFAKLNPATDLTDITTARHIFTHLLAFTANTIARSRTPRNARNDAVAKVTKFLQAHPDVLDGFDEERYLDVLRNPDKLRHFFDKNPMMEKLAPLLLQQNEESKRQQADVAPATAIRQGNAILYPILTPFLTKEVSSQLLRLKAKACLLVSDTINFITSDDPVVYLHHDIRVQGEQIPTDETWTDPSRAVFIPLMPRIAIYWNTGADYEMKKVSEERVEHLNRQMLANCIRQVFAAGLGDFPAPE